jgi:hypothetical protein
MRLRAVPALTALLALAGFAFAQDKPQLRWKLEKDRTVYQETVTESDQALIVMGMQLAVKARQTVVSSWTPIKQTDDRGWVVRQKVLAVKAAVDLGNNKKVAFDSTDPESVAKDLAPGIQAVIDGALEFTLGPGLKAEKVEGYKELVEKLGKASPQAKALLEGLFTEESLKQTSDHYFAILPGKPVSPNGSSPRSCALAKGDFSR